MLKKVFRFFLVLAALLLLALCCWLVGLLVGWPLWGPVALFLGLIAGYYVGRWLYRRWNVWRLQRKLARDMPAAAASVDHRGLERQWRAGIRMLREGGAAGAAAYGLPWLLSMNLTSAAADGAADDLAVKRLYPADDAPDGAAGLNWLFLRGSIMVDLTAGFVAQIRNSDDTLWQRLLYWLLKVRRREPLNGVVLRMDVGYLLQASVHDLAEIGRRARARMDDLARVMDARMPVWLVLTNLEALPGADAWMQRLSPALREDAFGHTRQGNAPPAGASDFLAESWPAIRRRLEELRLAQGMDAALPEEAFAFPEAVMALEPQLRALLVPAFDATPYAETALLQGLYFTQGSRPGEGHAFARGLYDGVLPAQRDAWIPLERWRNTRRLMRHAAVAAWLICVAGLLAVQYYAWRDVNAEVERLAVRPLSSLNFDGDLDEDLQSLSIWRDATIRLYEERSSWHRLLPFEDALQRLAKHYQEGFARIYRRDVLEHKLDPLVRDALPIAAAKGDNREIAAWAQHLVRRINLLRARLAARPLDAMPRPGTELQDLITLEGSRGIGIKGSILVGQFYLDYLRWEPQRAVLQTELASLEMALSRLGLGARSPEWMLSWVDMQGDIQPIRLSDFWNIPPDPDAPRVPAGLTLPGVHAVDAFAAELAQATGDKTLWDQRFREFVARFREAGFEAWRQFVSAFPEARKQLPNEGAWKSALASLFTQADPHLMLLQRIASLFGQLPPGERPVWISEAIELERVVRAAQSGSGVSGVVDKLRLTNVTGSEQLNALTQGLTGSLEDGVARMRGALGATTEIQEYRAGIAAATASLLQGEGSAADFAARTWRYGHDPQVGESPLHEAQRHVEAVWRELAGQNLADPVLLGLLRGPLDLTLEYAARAATCSLQSEWQTMVVGALQSVTSPRLADELLYGERGQVQAFMQGRIDSFVDRDGLRYRPRETLGMTLPLSGQFYAFASNVQLQHVERAERRIREEQLRKANELALVEHQERQKEIEQELAALRAGTLAVSIESTPPLVNEGAVRGPRRTRLALQCAQGAQSLDNYNFPTRAQFNWAADSCGDVELSIEFPDFTLVKRYPGQWGMLNFLDEFAEGQRSFTRADFPQNADAMMLAGLESVTLAWRIDGYERAQDTAHRQRALTAELAEQREAIRAARQQAAQLPADDEPMRELKGDLLPSRIAPPCWQQTGGPAYAAATPAPNGNGGQGGTARGLVSHVAPAGGPAGGPEAKPSASKPPAGATASGKGSTRTPAPRRPAATPASRDAAAAASEAHESDHDMPHMVQDDSGLQTSHAGPRPSLRIREVPADAVPSARTPAPAPASASSAVDTTTMVPVLSLPLPQPAPRTSMNTSTGTAGAGTATAPAASSRADLAQAGDSWRLQVGVYASDTRARQLLQAHGIPFITEVVNREGRTLTRILAGGYPDRESASVAAERIQTVLGTRPIILAPG